MFTGIIEDVGKVTGIVRFKDRMSLSVSSSFLDGVKSGESISVNGVCLTVTEIVRSTFKADISPETYERSALRYLNIGDEVNLEKAMGADGRFNGHIVLGHVDTRSMIVNISELGTSRNIEIKLPEEYKKYMTDKCSVSVDGVSLTALYPGRDSFIVSIIPHTALKTNLYHRKIGDWVNLEFDVLARYLEGLLRERRVDTLSLMKDMKIDSEFLKKAGFLN